MLEISVAAVAAVICSLIISALIRKFNWQRENFKKNVIPAVAGLHIVAFGVVGVLLSRQLPEGTRLVPNDSHQTALLYLILILGFGLLGLLDDLLGSRATGGFKGHFKTLLFERKLTTGAAKALGGGLIALYIGYKTSGGNLGLWAAHTALIGLAANTINLLDLRPGRALCAFFLGIGAVAAIVSLSSPIPIFAVVLAAAGVAHFDVRGKAMLGDVGSNTLGAVLGLTLVMDTSVTVRLVAIAVFLLINVYSERRSISKLIEHNPVLAYLDSKLGVR